MVNTKQKDEIKRFRGMEYGGQAAEAFVSALRNAGTGSLPG
jgi:hypothetical protein